MKDFITTNSITVCIIEFSRKSWSLVRSFNRKASYLLCIGEEFFYLGMIRIILKILKRPAHKTSQLMIIFTPNYLNKDKKELSSEYSYLLEPISKLHKQFGRFSYVIYNYEKFGSFISKFKFFRELNVCSNPKILLSSWSPQKISRGQPSPYFFKIIKKLYPNTEISRIGWDTVSEKYWELTNSFDFLKTDFVIDNPILWGLDVKKYPNSFKKVQIVDCPCDLELFTQKEFTERSNELCFMGRISSYRNYRSQYISELEKLSIKKVINATDKPSNFTSNADYFRILGDSKISLNFSMSVHFDQLKARVWESLLSGCLLLESSNLQIRYFFVPDVHFIEFVSVSDMVDKINYLLKNQNEMQDIAESGRKRVIEVKNNSDIFNKLFR